MCDKFCNSLERAIKVAVTILGILVLALIIIHTMGAKAFACVGNDCKPDGNVMDTNKGKAGQVLVYDCNIGNIDLGRWTDPSFLKGDKGEQGIQGLQGVQGLKGDKGDKGDDGEDFDPALYEELKNADTVITNNLIEEINNRIEGDVNLQNNIDQEITNRVKADKKLQRNINNEARIRAKADIKLQNNLNKEADKRIAGDKKLNTKINKETKERKVADKQLQKNINKEEKARIKADQKLNSRITDVDNTHTEWNTKQDNEIKNINNKNVQQDNRLDDLGNRTKQLERTQYIVETAFRIVDTKTVTISPTVRYNIGRNKFDIFGVRAEIKIAKSYEEKLIQKLNKRLDLLEKTLGTAPVIEKVVNEKGETVSMSITGNIQGQF